MAKSNDAHPEPTFSGDVLPGWLSEDTDTLPQNGCRQHPPDGRGYALTLALVVAGIGAVLVLGTWIGICVSDSADSDREALTVANLFTAQLDAEVQRWRGF